jgi:hypothetical protein
MAVILGPVNGMLADASSPDYANVQAVVARAETVTGAVEALGVLDTQTEEVVAEARAVLQALPAAVDEAVMADSGAIRVRLDFLAPPGDAFL